MKINKKLLMAALAGAIVVGGGVNTYADEPAPVNKEKEIENDYLDAAEKEYEKLNAVNDAEKEAKKEAEEEKNRENDYLDAAEKEYEKLNAVNDAEKEAKKEAEEEKNRENDYLDAAEKEYEKLNAVNDAEKEAEEEKPVVKDGYETYDEAVAAAKEVLKKDPINNAYKISLNQHGRFIYSLYIDNSDILEEKEPEGSNQFTNHEFVFRTKEQAEYAAKKALENDKINNAYEVVQKADGNWDYVLKIIDESEEQKPEEKPGKNPGITIDEWLKQQNKGRKVTIDQWLEENGLKDPEKTPEKPEVQNGFETEEEAIAAAKKALKDDKINNTFSVRQGADDKYYYVLGYEHKPLVTIDEWLANNTPEEEGKISDNWYDQSKHPFEENKEQKPEEKPGETPEPGVTPTPSVPENHYHENDYANIGAGEGTKEDGKKEDSKEESKENGKKEDSKENGKEEKTGKEEKPEKPDMPAKHEKLGKENTDSPNKKKDKAELPKAGSEAEILTLAAASLSSVAGAFISLKKRK